ncbi:hypothetical protein ACFFWC_30470 [Plantactinospora siamensis]|uniref:Agd3 CBM87 domain-containing protein n=1 Tax=Plantactinospora siamensis TaxID=555372 RepID=A0ABV6P644_9ACTN
MARSRPSPPVPRPYGAAPEVALPAPYAGAGPAGRVALRALVVAIDDTDPGLAVWRSTLDRVGAAYDVLRTRTDPLAAQTLVRPDGAGRYNAILLTSADQLYPSGDGYASGLDADEWAVLWAYERDWSVRQAVLYAAPGGGPDDYCLEPRGEGGVGETPLYAQLTTAGAGVFDYLAAAVRVPITNAYVYRAGLRSGCASQPVLRAGQDVLGVLGTAMDGRERLALTFSSDQHQLSADLLGYGLFRWASRGLFLGEMRHHLNVDVDDWFNGSVRYQIPGAPPTSPTVRLTGHDAYNAYQRQAALRARYPLAGGLTLNLAFNGGGADLAAGRTCYPSGGEAQLTSTSRCLAGQFRWINHTLAHPELNDTDYATTRDQIAGNLTVAATLGLRTDATILKTPEYSGLGVYSESGGSDVLPPVDHGLAASNPALIQAATELGVRVLHGNMSFPSQVPPVFNGGIPHPLAPGILVVPDWPTNIAYHVTNPAEETSFYNSYYGPGGLFPYWPRDLSYQEVISAEIDVAFAHVASGSIYTHTFHIANLKDYGEGRTLVTDYLDSLLARYTSYYRVPLINSDCSRIAEYARLRNSHAATLAAGADAVLDRSTGRVTVTSPVAGQLIVSGAQTTGATSYGSDISAVLTLAPGTPVTFAPRERR